jgi:hypothetical protein
MTATANVSAPQAASRAEELLAWARRTETFRELIPADAALGWPAVSTEGDSVLLTVPVFAQKARPQVRLEL